jgi:tetratricopeptide (TPR) repeat protein
MPGAFAYHLHSFSAASLRTTNRFWVGPLLAKGATATMGCVDEPYLSGTPDMAVFCARFIYAGFSFGEAACAAQPVLSWQTTVVGDPLYRPFGKNPDLLAAQLQQRRSKLLEWCLLRLLNLNLAANKPLGEGIEFLEGLGETSRSAVLTEKLGNLYAAQGKPESAVYAWNNALRLYPSPLQRVRLLLTLAEHLTRLGRDAEAYADYQQLLVVWPDYPDKPDLYRALLPLAQKLDKKADAEKYEAELKPKT